MKESTRTESPSPAAKRFLQMVPWGLVAAVIAAVIVLLMPQPEGLHVVGQRMLAILVFAVIIWISEAVSYEVSALILIALMTFLLGTAPSINDPTVIIGTNEGLAMGLAGFASPALLLVAVALFIAVAMTHTGLDRRIALVTLARMGSRPKRVLMASLVISALLSFLVPSATARVACVVPIMLGAITAFGVDRKSRLAGGLMILVAQATSIWNVGVMTAAAQNLLTIGFMRSGIGETVTWTDWLIAGAPWSMIMTVVAYFVILHVIPPESHTIEGGKETIKRQLAELGPMSHKEKFLLYVMLILLAVWFTGGKLHSFSTPSTTLVGLAILMLPKVGVMDWREVQKKIPWGTVLVFGAGISLGTAMLKTQAGGWMAQELVAILGLQQLTPFMAFATLAAFLIIVHIGFASATALSAAMLPIMIAMLGQLGGDVNVLGMTMLLGFVISFGFILPINAPQNMVCIGTETFTSKQFSHTGIYLTVIGYVLMLIFALTYWRWLGLV